MLGEEKKKMKEERKKIILLKIEIKRIDDKVMEKEMKEKKEIGN